MFIFKRKDGKEVALLNPSEKGKKFATELKNNMKQTNDGFLKKDEFNRPIQLEDNEHAYRAGYLAARKDSAGAFKSQQKKRGK